MLSKFFSRFHIGAYCLQKNARTEQHIKDLKNCGIDLLFGINNDPDALELLNRYGIFAVVSGVVPGWFGGNGTNAGTMRQTNTEETYVEAIKAFRDHPAIIGIDMGDEPSALDFPYYGEIIALIKKSLPHKLPYLNLYPSYGMLGTNTKAQAEKELGTASYREYLECYGKHVLLPYISFDHYVCTSDEKRFFSDLFTAASLCRESRKRLFVVLQVNSRERDVFISEETLCFQAFSALAYGASAVSWACYSPGWWHNQVLDRDGNKTEQYEKLKRVNRKLRQLTKVYMQYHWVDTQIIHSDDTGHFEAFRSIIASQDALLGKFKSTDGKKAIFLSFPDRQSFSGNVLRFQLDSGKPTLWKPCGKYALFPDSDNTYQVILDRCEACFITID